ncbi:kelch-like ECH-associated protein 1A [Argiope bruennichi]|uniref:BTB/POZ domain-containing protein 3 n=1 Tax=Argiope bruennichi TaxID=94029 RepID=A0A8T0E1G7_ARGBR|nr:kelch-like ECH-associated protein 1A [Argiope bruennichi]KAF8763957.1 BTB/POZ domain-containing protein 3 [Argiope bruennichi]
MYEARNFYGNAAGTRLFFNERDSDVSIRVEWEGQKWQFPGHKLVLCTMSDVFRTMLETDMLEKSSNIITIKDSCPYAVKQFLKYLYMGTVDFTNWLQAVNLLKIAHKYSVQTLISLSEAYLITTVVFSNACSLYELARTYSLKLLKKHTQLFIMDSGFIVSATEGFFNLRPRSLETFLSSSLFNMENEGTVLTCLREWAVCECSRRCMALSRSNVLSAMEPYFKYIRWTLIPESHRTFVPQILAEKYKDDDLPPRRAFRVPNSLQFHINYVKFVVELGAFYEQIGSHDQNICISKFTIDNHVFMAGFRIVGLFKAKTTFLSFPCFLTLSREENKTLIQFNLNSLAWTKGANAGNEIWHEMIAYLPYPIRLDPFSTYTLTLRIRRSKEIEFAKWPRTRLDSEIVVSDLGSIIFKSFGCCFGLTQLFILPASPYRNICNTELD